MHLLLLSSDSAPARTLRSALEAHTFAVSLASPSEVMRDVDLGEYEVVILDLDDAAMKAADGFAVLRRLRRVGWRGRVVAIKKCSTVIDRIAILNAGADDFLSQPVDPDELSARIEALMRRGAEYSSVLHVADLELDPLKRKVRRGDRLIALTPREFDLLEFLLRHREQPLTRARIVRHVWNHHFDGLTNVVDVYIAYLRRKIDDGFPLKLIRTERGVGYVLRDPLPHA